MLKTTYNILFFALISFMLGCSSGSRNASDAPTITTQPLSQTVAVGQAATFTVTARGAQPLTYKWSWNGMAMNANGDTFTTPPAVSSDNQTTLTVTVTNQAGVSLSREATLFVTGSPRRPNAGDLRFKDVGMFPLPLSAIQTTAILGGMSRTFPNQVGTPLQIGWPGPRVPDGNPASAAWFFSMYYLPEGAVGRTNSYKSGILSNFVSDLENLKDSTTVITSLDLCSGQNDYALQAVKTDGSDAYSFDSGVLLPADFEITVKNQGEAGRVITAVSLVGGQVTFISYGRPGDTSTVYESVARPATISTINSVATELAQQGFVITAVGGNGTDGFIFVGTKVKGDMIPRPILITTNMVADRGFTMVGSIYVFNPISMSSGSYLYIYEQ